MVDAVGHGSGAPSESARGREGDAAPVTPKAVPYRRGLVSSLLAWLSRRPGGSWWIVAFGIALLAWGQGVEWIAGRMPVGSVDQHLLAAVPYGPFSVLMLLFGIRVSRRALQQFWPATGWPDTDRPAWEYRFTALPFRPEYVALSAGAVAGVVSLLSAPASVIGPERDRWVVFAAYLPAFLAGYGMLGFGVLATFRWLRLVAEIHRKATAVDVFDRVPIYAFSRLTAVVGITFLFAAYYSLTVNAAYQVGNVASIATIGLIMLFAAASFVLPMWGIHGRLAREKEALLLDAERRVNALAAELYARIDAGKFDATEVVTISINGVNALRERIERLPTWPWPPQVLRGFVTALLLPLLIFVLTRLISDLI